MGFTLLEETSSSTSATACDGYVWNDSLYTTSGTYDWQGTNVEGCDSVATLGLTIHPSWAIWDEAGVNCEPYLWNGNLLEVSGNYVFEGTSSMGCDSIVSIEFTLSETAESTLEASSCDSELERSDLRLDLAWCVGLAVWRRLSLRCDGRHSGELHSACLERRFVVFVRDLHVRRVDGVGCDSVVTMIFDVSLRRWLHLERFVVTSGTYDWQGTNVEGCDSVATLELTVYDSWSVTDDAQESCTPLVWNDVLLSSSGTYTYEGSTAFGCDSVVTIGFTLLETEQVVVTAQGCDSVFVESQWLSEVALYDFEYQDDNGCVGLVTYDVQLDYSSESWTTLQSCDSLLWNDLLLQESAVYSFSTVNAAGCDSVAYVEFTLAELSGAELDLPEFVCLGDEVNAGLGDWQPEDQTVVYWSFEGGDTSDVYNLQIPSLVPGTFEVTVILDAAFCNEQLQGSYEVLDLPENHLEDPLLFHPTCAGFSDGAIQVLHSGDLDLTYVWNPNSLSGNVGTQLEAGEYEVTVSNNGYCPYVLELQLLEPEPLVLEVLIELGTPCGSNEGQLEIDIQGGTSLTTSFGRMGARPPPLDNWQRGNMKSLWRMNKAALRPMRLWWSATLSLTCCRSNLSPLTGMDQTTHGSLTMLSIIQICRFVFTIDGARWSSNTRVLT